MKLIRKSCSQGATEAEGITVVIDVFRAFTCEPFFFHFGANKVILQGAPEKAIETKSRNPGFILAGEVNEVPIRGGDLGNSPSEILLKGEDFFQGKTVIHRTTAGVTGASLALEHAEEVLLGSFVTAAATAAYIRRKCPQVVTLVAMGSRGKEPSPEDEACADYLASLLIGAPYDRVGALREILFHRSAQKFLKGEKPYLPREDPAICLMADLFDFALRAQRDGDVIMASMVEE
jgi:2-phosphosulfolactate phosphatase